MKKKILPVTMPLTDCYPATSGASAILFADDNISDWMFNNFIQIFEVEGNHALDYYDFSIDNNIFLSYNEIDYSFIHSNWKSLTDFIISAIEDDYYVRMFVNRQKLPLYKEQWNQQHDILIYGFNRGQKLFSVADHFADGKFSFGSCSFPQLMRAADTFKPRLFQQNPAFLNCVQLIRKEPDLLKLRYSMYTRDEMERITSFQTDRVRESLEDYLNCRPTKGWFTRGHVMDDMLASSHHWGTDCYNVLEMFCENWGDITFDSSFAGQSFYLMANHKKVMEERLKIIKKYNPGFPVENHEAHFAELAGRINTAMLRYIRMNMYQKDDSAGICQAVREIRQMDIRYTEDLIRDLKP